jgi:hypothetical protein
MPAPRSWTEAAVPAPGRRNVDGAEEIEVVLAQLPDAAAEIEELALAGYLLERRVEADGLRLSSPGQASRKK